MSELSGEMGERVTTKARKKEGTKGKGFGVPKWGLYSNTPALHYSSTPMVVSPLFFPVLAIAFQPFDFRHFSTL